MSLFKSQYDSYKAMIDKRLLELIEIDESINCKVSEAMKYSLNIGGKRIRPVFVLSFCECFGGDVKKAIDVACAVEMIHTYSLIHDDLPCMDDDDIRRGKPACHIKYGQAIALLAGDGLLTQAFNVISSSDLEDEKKVEIIREISESAGYKGMILGQDLDISAGENIDIDALTNINRLKTGRLLKSSILIGCLVAGASQSQRDMAAEYGELIGLAYQIKDDIIDVIGHKDDIGKPTHSDKKNNKNTYVDLLGIVRCESKVKELSLKALKKLEAMSVSSEFLLELTRYLLGRNN